MEKAKKSIDDNDIVEDEVSQKKQHLDTLCFSEWVSHWVREWVAYRDGTHLKAWQKIVTVTLRWWTAVVCTHRRTERGGRRSFAPRPLGKCLRISNKFSPMSFSVRPWLYKRWGVSYNLSFLKIVIIEINSPKMSFKINLGRLLFLFA